MQRGPRRGAGSRGAGTVWRELLEWLERTHPGLARWLGDRVDLQVPAVALSLVTHVAVLTALALSYVVHEQVTRPEIEAEVGARPPADLTKLDDSTAIAATDGATTMLPTSGSFSTKVSALIVNNPVIPDTPVAALKPEMQSSSQIVLPRAVNLGTSVSIRGSGTSHVEGGVDAAVDRLAVEILRQVEQGRTLVVWAFDASGSLTTERARLAKHIQQVYAHIREFDNAGKVAQGGLLTMVVSFGHDRKPMLAEPTADPQAIASAIDAVPLDTTGIETTFQTVADIARRWGKFKQDGKNYRVVTIVVTDEVGDDQDKLEGAIAAANAAKMPVFVLGSPALFGRKEGYMDYKDPKTGQMYRHLPVIQGPESVDLEQIRLPFWYDGPRYEIMDAGFGPYALSRMAGATGGIYFVTRMGTTQVTFDPAGMREYKPDWVSKDQYEKALTNGKHPVRAALKQAALITQQDLPDQPGLTFPAVDDPAFKEVMTRNQTTVARIAYTVDQALGPIAQAAKARDKETSRRWQAHYDLARGRLMAMKLRCFEYNFACANMKKDAGKFTKPGSNAWKLVPDEQVRYSDKAASAAAEAKMLLQRVITDHPGTPWALLAARELKDPFGFKWVETTAPPPPKMDNNAAEAKKKKAEKPGPKPKPPELPKL